MRYEGKMMRSTLRKAIAYSNELLDMVNVDDEVEPWVLGKVSEMGHHIEAIHSYYKFGEPMDDEMDDEEEMDEKSETIVISME